MRIFPFSALWRWLALASMTVIVFNLGGCGESPNERDKREKAAREQQQQREEDRHEQLLAELKQQYNADSSWDKGGIAWTVELQERLVRSDGRPIVGTAKLADVEKEGERYLLHLVQDPLRGLGIEFLLRCNRPEKPDNTEAVSPFRSQRFRLLFAPQYLFVAKINAVRRKETTTVGGSSSEASEVDYRQAFVAEGECLALRELRPEPVENESGASPAPVKP